MNDKGVVIFSSLKDILKTATDADFPKFPDSIGILVQNNRSGVTTISTHTPRITSLVEGERIEDCSESTINSIVKAMGLDLAQTCRLLSAHLIEQAERLELIAGKTEIHISEPIICKPRASMVKTPDIAQTMKDEASDPLKRTRLDLNLFAD